MASSSRALVASLALNAVLVIGLAFVLSGSASGPSTILSGGAAKNSSSREAQWRAERRSVLAELGGRPGGLVVVGDSLVERGEWAELLAQPSARNRGVAGDTTADVLARLDETLAPPPERIVLLVGTNDLERGLAVADVVATYDRILSRAAERAPAAKVVVIGVPPVRDGLAGVGLRNDAIVVFDAALRDLARSRGCRYVDAIAALADAGGQLDARFTVDGVHLRGAGYAALGRAVTAALSTIE